MLDTALRIRPAALGALLLLGSCLPAAAVAGFAAPVLQSRAALEPEARVVCWVRFTDRAGAEHAADMVAHAQLSPRSLERRALRGTLKGVVAADLPVHRPYVQALVERGALLRGTSRWLNAASVEMPASLAPELARLPFVAGVDPVPVAASMRKVDEPVAAASVVATESRTGESALDMGPGAVGYYGDSYKQLAMMQVPALHSWGLSGFGVFVCMLDTGFRTTHEMFSSLHIVATRDFIHHDAVVDDETGQDASGAGSHGTMTLGCVAGCKPGVYSGSAFAATVALGKTENSSSELPIEMDYWQFGAEWADSLGADIISSSLSYSTFDAPAPSYSYADMDGNTTVVTRAAVAATRRGIIVVNAAGNEGSTPWHYITAPADADTVITVGAVDSFNVVTNFSSWGPTADGRMKPDVTAMGKKVLVPSFNGHNTYERASGTSFSCPLTAGVAALLLEAHPGWGPWEVREALRTNALNHAVPNTQIGWGLVQAFNADCWLEPAAVPLAAVAANGLALAAGPNPLRAGQALSVRFSAPRGEDVSVEVLDLTGRRVALLHRGPIEGEQEVRWSGNDAAGVRAPAGVYWVRVASRTRARALRVARLR